MKSQKLRSPAFLAILFLSISTLSGPSLQSATASSESAGSLIFQGEPVTLKLVDVSLVDFFRAISELSGLNILIDPDVTGTITINVEQVPWDQLFDAVLRSHGLARSVEGNLVRISTKNTLREEDEADQALKRAAFMAKDVETVTKELDYANGEELLPSLEKQLSERGQINVDKRTNTLIITDVPASVTKIDSLITALDVPEKQVEIEARIIEATTRFARELGMELGFLIGSDFDRNQGAGLIAAPVADPVGAARFSTGKALDMFRLDAIISAAEATGDARILSKPRVSAQNNAEAIITQGSKIPIPVQINFTTTVRYETAALQLTVTPQITEVQTVSLAIKVENNVPDFSQTVLGIPTILTSESQTQVLVADGETTVIGGIYVEQDRNSQDRVPGLGSIPVVGNLFKKSGKQRETREILFFITPRIKK
ncbi:MAG: type IV pilus secretin PilQ [Acidobacteriota bacterium]